MLFEVICVFMTAVWFKIVSRIDICMNVIRARQATLDTEAASIQELLNDSAELRKKWQGVWNEALQTHLTLALMLSLDLRRNVSVGKGKGAYYRTFIFYAIVDAIIGGLVVRCNAVKRIKGFFGSKNDLM